LHVKHLHSDSDSERKHKNKHKKTINTMEINTIMKSDSGREHVRRMIGIFWFWWRCEEILRGLVIE